MHDIGRLYKSCVSFVFSNTKFLISKNKCRAHNKYKVYIQREKEFPIFVGILRRRSQNDDIVTLQTQNLIFSMQSRKTSLWLDKHGLIDKVLEQLDYAHTVKQ